MKLPEMNGVGFTETVRECSWARGFVLVAIKKACVGELTVIEVRYIGKALLPPDFTGSAGVGVQTITRQDQAGKAAHRVPELPRTI